MAAVSTDVLLGSGSPATADTDAVLIAVLPDGDAVRLAPGAEEVEAAFDGELIGLLALVGATGKADEVVRIPTRGALTAPLLVVVGLGKPENGGGDDADGPSAEQVRRASGAAARALAGTDRVVSTLGRLDLAAAVEGSLLGGYTFREYRSNGPGKAPVGRIELLTGGDGDGNSDADEQSLRTAVALAAAVATTRDLVNTPPNDLYPATFAERAVELAAAAGVEVLEVLDEQGLAEGGFGGVLGVGGGSARKPRLVRLRWSGGDAPRAKVALVGKGITFDTGGISIKPAAGMDHMTSDMGGAAAVIATVALAARLELPVEVTATVPMAENMPSGDAYRPGDVLRMYGGKTVEVMNTDAEGRLVLGDAMARAAEDSPDYLIEVSTLTGAQMVGLGMRTCGVMGSEAFRDRVAGHATATGEGGWAMPLPSYLRSELDSRVADMVNVTGTRWGGMLVAGVFLGEFVPDGLDWVHIDIAGPSFHAGGPYGYTTKGGTGVPVRTLFAVLSDIAANG